MCTLQGSRGRRGTLCSGARDETLKERLLRTGDLSPDIVVTGMTEDEEVLYAVKVLRYKEENRSS